MLSQFALLILGFFSQRAMNLYMGAEVLFPMSSISFP